MFESYAGSLSVCLQTLDALTAELWTLHRNFSALEAKHLEAVDDVAELHIVLREQAGRPRPALRPSRISKGNTPLV